MSLKIDSRPMRHQVAGYGIVAYMDGDGTKVELRSPGRSDDFRFRPEGTESFSEAYPELAREISDALHVNYQLKCLSQPKMRDDHKAWLRLQLMAIDEPLRKTSRRGQNAMTLQRLFVGHCELVLARIKLLRGEED